jgi:hypothetical protein
MEYRILRKSHLFCLKTRHKFFPFWVTVNLCDDYDRDRGFFEKWGTLDAAKCELHRIQIKHAKKAKEKAILFEEGTIK